MTAPFVALEHHRHGHVTTRLLPGLALGSLVGAPLASLAAQRLPQSGLARGFAVFLLANAPRMIWVTAQRARSRPAA